MRVRHTPLLAQSIGNVREIVSFHYGAMPSGHEGQKIYIQSALHADEPPGLLVCWYLKQKLAVLEAAGRLRGEVVVVPVANPIGASQHLLGVHQGRFEASSGENFNRHYADLSRSVADSVEGSLSGDERRNKCLVRHAIRSALDEQEPSTELQSLRLALQRLSSDADVVIDLHCENEGVMHLYTGTPVWEEAEPLARYLGAQTVLLANESGDTPFDEAAAQTWWKLQERFGETFPIPNGSLSLTIELRGESDVDHASAMQDAQAILDYLTYRGTVAGETPAMPALLCEPTPLAGMAQLLAPVCGVIVYRKQLADHIKAGETVADIVDPLSDSSVALTSPVDGFFFARRRARIATTGSVVARIAGSQSFRSGRLLTA